MVHLTDELLLEQSLLLWGGLPFLLLDSMIYSRNKERHVMTDRTERGVVSEIWWREKGIFN